MIGRKPEISLGVGIAAATIAIALYNKGLPTSADVRAGKPGDETLEAVRKQNAWMAAGAVAGISLIAKDPTVFVIGGLTVVALDWSTRFNNWTDPITNAISGDPFTAPAPGDSRLMQQEEVANPYTGLNVVA